MGRSKLKVALAADKGVDFKKLKEKKKHKERAKKRHEREGKHGGAAKSDDAEDDDDDDWEGVDDEEEEEGGAPVIDDEAEEDDDDGEEDADDQIDFAGVDESDDSDSSIELEKKIERPKKPALQAKNAATNGKKKAAVNTEDDSEDEEEDEEDIPMSDLEDLPDDEKEDMIPHSRLTINNTTALLASLSRIAIPTDASVPFATHQSVVGAAPTADGIEDIQDDLKRELAFYAQSLDAARRARALLRAEGVPFSRPPDYFAEMVKDDGHMEKVKAKLVEEASAKKASADARRQRDLKKFGKQVQQAKLQERQKAKRDTLDKIKTLKRKRQESSTDVGAREADLFDVGVDAELGKHSARSAFSRGRDGESRSGGSNAKRQKKNDKYGFGGKKRHAKSGDAASAGDLSGFSARRMKGGRAGGGGKPVKASRPGKNRRAAGAARR
ncbi:Ebp2-domain-containing protein [Hypoxylon sp. FL1284]|nr:Ebp2-domain-containing protein [Hypoxylon sp. FL1284]